jgi:hypothetical protein
VEDTSDIGFRPRAVVLSPCVHDPPRPSVSPLPSYCATAPVRRSRGSAANGQNLRQGILEREVVEILAEEFDDAAAQEADGGTVSASAQVTRSFDSLRRLL